MRERSGSGWNGYVEGAGPLQGCGRVDGFPWYFRARGDSWSIEIAEDASLDPEVLPVVGGENSGWLVEEDFGVWPEASYMNPNIAWSLIEECIERFRAKQIPYISAKPATP